jgi:hypothetical protein
VDRVQVTRRKIIRIHSECWEAPPIPSYTPSMFRTLDQLGSS